MNPPDWKAVYAAGGEPGLRAAVASHVFRVIPAPTISHAQDDYYRVMRGNYRRIVDAQLGRAAEEGWPAPADPRPVDLPGWVWSHEETFEGLR